MIRKIVICLIALMPFNKIRLLLYRYCLNYKIDLDSYVGMFNYLDCSNVKLSESTIGVFNYINTENLVMQKSVIGKFNKVKFLRMLRMNSRSVIRSKNVILGTTDFFSPYLDTFNFEIGENSLITSNHYFDCTSNIKIGNNVVFGGINSQIWTHGFDKNRTMILGDITIENDIYIGSNVMILQNVFITSNVSIGAGSIISKNINESGFYVSSTLIRKGDVIDYSTYSKTIIHEGSKFYRK